MLKIVIAFVFVSSLLFSQDFQYLGEFGNQGRDDGVAFSIGKYGYLVTGNVGGNTSSDELLQFDSELKTWGVKAPFPGTKRQYAGQFVIQGKAYVFCGISFENQNLKDVWEYNPSTNHWTQKKDFPGAERRSFFTFSLSECGILGTGVNQSEFFDDCWKYNPKTDSWSPIAPFPGGKRREVVSLTISEKCFAGTGFSTFPETFYNDFYEYHILDDRWTRIADFPGFPRAYAVAQGARNSGIVGSGWENSGQFFSDFFILSRDGIWSEFPISIGKGIRGMSSFSVGDMIYLTSGLSEDFIRVSDMYALELKSAFTTTLYPNPSDGHSIFVAPSGTNLCIYDETSQLVYETEIPNCGYVDLPVFPAGMYLLRSQKNDEKRLDRYSILRTE